MMNHQQILSALTLSLAFVFAAACSDDTKSTPRGDQGAPLADSGTEDVGHQSGDALLASDTTLVSDTRATRDTAMTPDIIATPDAIVAEGKETCPQVLTCAEACTDPTCVAACVGAGTKAARLAFATVATCTEAAIAGGCAAKCANPRTAQCINCHKVACIKDLDICYGANPTAGFGALCTAETPCTNTDTQCIYAKDTAVGYCRTTCPTISERCPGSPSGTAAFCVNKVDGENLCGFLCGLAGVKWPCPSGLVCETDTPSGMGQFACRAPQPQK